MYVRRGALEELARFRESATALVAEALHLDDDTLAARAAQLLGQVSNSEVSRNALRAALGDARQYVRLEVAHALGGLGESMRSMLVIARQSDSATVREGATMALEYLDFGTTSPIAGRCFRLMLTPWLEALAIGEDSIFSTPPRVVRFSTVKRAWRSYDESLWMRVEPTLGEPHSVHGPGFWRPYGDSVEVAWSTGFSGLTMNLHTATDTLRGLASTFWDFPRPTQVAQVLGVPTRCAAP